MKIEKLDSHNGGENILCDTYRITEVSSFQTLKDIYREYSARNKKSSVLMTLDDLAQAQYTSYHSTVCLGLDEVEGYDLSNIDPSAFEDGEHLGYLSTPSEFFIRQANFEKQVKGRSFKDACERGITIDTDERLLLKEIHLDPLDMIDDEILFMVVPVKRSYEALCYFPNGYFSGDFDPFDIFYIAKHLYEKFGYVLFGVGASLLGFFRENILSDVERKALESDVAKIYNHDALMSSTTILEDWSLTNEVLFLKYVEYLEP